MKTLKDWLIVIALLLDEFIVAGLVLLILWQLKIPITLPVIISLVIFIVIFFLLTHKAIIPSLRRKRVTGMEGMVGLEGKVVEPLIPSGIIRVKGEYWKAKSASGNINVGEIVVVLGLRGLILEVERKHDLPAK